MSGFEIRLGSLYRAAYPAEHIQLPAGVKTNRKEFVFISCSAVFAAAIFRGGSSGVQGGKKIRLADAPQGPGFTYTGHGLFQIKIPLDSAFLKAG